MAARMQVLLFVIVTTVGYYFADAATPWKLRKQISRTHERAFASRARVSGDTYDDTDGKIAKWAEERKKVFRPSTTACCKLGYKAARKGLDCSTSITASDRMYSAFLSEGVSTKSKNYHVPDHVEKLANNIDICIKESYNANYKKCCQLKTDYKQAMQMCRRFKGPKKDMRRKCRDKVRDMYQM